MYQSPAAHGPGSAPPAEAGLGELLRWGSLRLGGVPDTAVTEATAADATRDAAVLLAAAAKVTRAMLLAFPERTCGAAERERFLDWIERRRSGEPVAYLLGRREFWSLELRVTPDVLVPRPETELLVERALELGDASPRAVLDLGTGSGAIALALARERPAWRITASDTSPAALEVARDNALRLGLGGVEFRLGDWFDVGPGARPGGRYALVVSNPPYVAGDDPALADPVLRHEPRIALTPGRDGLAALRTIIAAAPAALEPGGWLLLEHGATQAPAVAAELVARGFRHVRSRRDLAGHERISEGQWPGP